MGYPHLWKPAYRNLKAHNKPDGRTLGYRWLDISVLHVTRSLQFHMGCFEFTGALQSQHWSEPCFESPTRTLVDNKRIQEVGLLLPKNHTSWFVLQDEPCPRWNCSCEFVAWTAAGIKVMATPRLRPRVSQGFKREADDLVAGHHGIKWVILGSPISHLVSNFCWVVDADGGFKHKANTQLEAVAVGSRAQEQHDHTTVTTVHISQCSPGIWPKRSSQHSHPWNPHCACRIFPGRSSDGPRSLAAPQLQIGCLAWIFLACPDSGVWDSFRRKDQGGKHRATYAACLWQSLRLETLQSLQYSLFQKLCCLSCLKQSQTSFEIL